MKLWATANSRAVAMERLEERKLLSAVSGTVYRDLNIVGAHAGPANTLPGLRVFVDRNGNQTLDEAEVSTVSGGDGTYRFDDLAPGPMTIRIGTDGWSHSLAPEELVLEGDSQLTQDMFLYESKLVRGRLFNDLDGDGARDADEPPLANVLVYGGGIDSIDVIAGGPSYPWGFNFVGLGLVHSIPVWQRTAEDGGFTLHIPQKAFGDIRIDIPGSWKITTTDADSDLEIGLSEFPPSAMVKGIVFGDINGDRIMNGQDHAMDRALVVITSNGVPIQSMITGSDGAYELSVDASKPGLELGIYGAEGYRFRDPTISLSLTAGEIKTIILPSRSVFVPAYSEVTGVVFQDVNGNGSADAGERVFPGLGVYYDANLNGRFDEGEAKVITDGQGRYSRMMIDVSDTDAFGLSFDPPTAGWSWRVLQFSGANQEKNIAVTPPATWTPLPPSPTGKVKGRVFDDVNGNGVMDAGEKPVAGAWVVADRALDDDPVPFYVLQSARTNAAGEFDLNSLPAGHMNLRVGPVLGLYMDAHVISLIMSEGETKVVDIPVRLYANVYGVVLENRGKRDRAPLAGARIYLDQNNNGKRDAGERRGISTAAGYFFFNHVPAGNAVVRLERLPPHMRLIAGNVNGVAVRGKAVGLRPFVLTRVILPPRERMPLECAGEGSEARSTWMRLCRARGT
jgi:hypothetical protein